MFASKRNNGNVLITLREVEASEMVKKLNQMQSIYDDPNADEYFDADDIAIDVAQELREALLQMGHE